MISSTSFEGWNQSELTSGRSDPGQWYNNISYFSEVEGQPNLLLFWLTGAAVEVADCLEDQEVMEAVTGLLRRVTGDSALPSPDRLIRSVSVSIYAYISLNLKESLFMYSYSCG